jgi:hypothetical protein
MFSSPAESNHAFVIVDGIVECYLKVRLHHLTKELSSKVTGSQVRKKLTKLIHFHN